MTIFCLTYNHATYIRDALNGFLNQKTFFKYNVLVFDDASTDGTSEILRDYQQRFPEIFNVYISPENTYGKSQRRIILNELYERYVLGEYVAWCEGDDAWSDCNKLQIQVDYMDEHQNCMMTTHAFRRIDYSTRKDLICTFGDRDRILSKDEIILQPQGNLGTASLVMRKSIFLRNDGFPVCDVEDYPMQLYAIFHGYIYYFNREMSLYRYMHDGSWCKQSNDNIDRYFYHKVKFVEFLLECDKYSNQKYTELMWKRIVTYLYDAVADLCRAKDPKRVIRNIVAKGNRRCNSLIDCIVPVYEWMSESYVVDESVRQYIQGFENVFIMGRGKYSEYIVKGLVRNHIDYHGFMVSKKENESHDERVWSVADYPYEKEKTLVIVGISQMNERDIVKILKESGFKDIWYPLWFTKEAVVYEN